MFKIVLWEYGSVVVLNHIRYLGFIQLVERRRKYRVFT